jgi:hypothetical protein
MMVPTGGPKSEKGKEVVRWNATRHGISSPAPVVPGVEKGRTGKSTETACWRASPQ